MIFFLCDIGFILIRYFFSCDEIFSSDTVNEAVRKPVNEALGEKRILSSSWLDNWYSNRISMFSLGGGICVLHETS